MYYKIKNTTLDLSKKQLKINNKIVGCSEKVHQSLIVFLNSKNQTLTKEQLMQALWGDLIVSDDSLFKVIQLLRKIFKENNLDGILVNVYGKGYKLKESVEICNQLLDVEASESRLSAFSLFTRYKKTIAVILGICLFALTTYYYATKNSETLINTSAYLEYKTEIKANPTNFLSTVDKTLQFENLDKKSKVNYFSLKSYAHFVLGDYENLFTYADKAIKEADGKKSLAIADNYLHYARVYYYRADGKKSRSYIEKSYQMYSDLDFADGMYNCQYVFLNLRYLAKEYELEFSEAQTVYEKAKKENHGVGQIISLQHMYFASSALNKNEGANTYVLQALEIAIKLNKKDLISMCYGILAEDDLSKGNFVKAMKWSNEILKYAVSQPNTNLFMQGFSYMYNILSPLGYDGLAEKYLQKGIDLQAHLNSEGHLHEAEINLGVLKIKLGKYKQAQKIFTQLNTYKLSTIDQLRVQAWESINRVKMQDNISAYAIAKDTFNNSDSPVRVKFVAGMALVISAAELERVKESELAFEQLIQMADNQWLIEYQMYLDLVKRKSKSDVVAFEKYSEKQKLFDQKVNKIRELAVPNKDTFIELDEYLKRVLSD